MSDAVSDYLWRLYVPAEKLSFTVAEALEAMGRAVHPDPNPTAPVMIREARKVPLGANPSRAYSLPLDEADWDALRLVWSRLDAPSFPMPESAWKAYADAFEVSRNRPKEWTLAAIQQDPELQTELRRAFLDDAHRRKLQEKVGTGAIRVRNPLTGDDADLLWRADQDDWLLSRQQFKALCNSRAIEFIDAPNDKASSHSVVDVAREAAALRQPLPDHEEDEVARTLAVGWRDWTQQALLRQANGYAYDRKISVFSAGAPRTTAVDPFALPSEMWRVDGQGREALLKLFRDDPVEVRPTFDMPPRPSDIPATLRLLDPNQSVSVRWSWRRISENVGAASHALKDWQDVVDRQAAGWFVIDEVAELLRLAGAGDRQTWIQKLKKAAEQPAKIENNANLSHLSLHEAPSGRRIDFEVVKGSRTKREVSISFDWLHLKDVNRWLDTNEPRLTSRLDQPQADAHFKRDGWIGHSTARRQFNGESWNYEDPENQSFAIDLLLHGQSLVLLDAFIERLEAEGAPAGAELRERRLDAWERRSNREEFKRHIEWILTRKREIETAEKAAAGIGRLKASLEARAEEASDKATAASHQEPPYESAPQRRLGNVSVVCHSTVGRREDLLTPVLRKAAELAGSGASAAQVWVQLEHLARAADRPAPLADVTSGGVVYYDGSKKRTFTLAALRDRLRRARTRGNTL